MVLVAVGAVPPGSRPPAVDGSMQTSTGEDVALALQRLR